MARLHPAAANDLSAAEAPRFITVTQSHIRERWSVSVKKTLYYKETYMKEFVQTENRDIGLQCR